MTLPGEKHAWWVIESPLTSSWEKAEARVKLAQIEEIKRENERRLQEYRKRNES